MPSSLLTRLLARPHFLTTIYLPAGLAQTRHVAAHGRFAQLVAAERELAIDAARTAGQRAAVALARRAGVAWQLLQLRLRSHLVVVGRLRAEHDRLELLAARRVLLDDLRALLLALNHVGLCHAGISLCQLRNGKLNASSNALAS